MKQIITFPKYLAIVITLLFMSCKKESTQNSDSLTSGTSRISFNFSPAFQGSSSYSSNYPAVNRVLTYSIGTLKQIALRTEEPASVNAKVVGLSIFVDQAATTSTGNITLDLNGSSTTAGSAILSLGSASGDFTSTNGTATITKLNSTDIEGTFSCTISDGTNNYSLTNGTFAAKF